MAVLEPELYSSSGGGGSGGGNQLGPVMADAAAALAVTKPTGQACTARYQAFCEQYDSC